VTVGDAQSIWLAPLMCIVSFFILAIFSRKLPYQGIYIPIGAMVFALIVFLLALVDYQQPVSVSLAWFEVAGINLAWDLHVDAVSLSMIGLIAVVSLMVQIYSLQYMRGEERIGWYYAVLSLFAASMMLVVLSWNLVLLYAAWELVGVCSYLLIGFWYERRSAAEAAKKAFITTRIGDVGLLIGIIVLFKGSGSFHVGEILEAVRLGTIDSSVLTLGGFLMLLGAMGKSAQFPFHVWLPDAMEGPTPVSALIHAATMVVAGVFLIARLFPLFEAADYVLDTVLFIGILTAFIAAMMALVATDLKQVLAYSTISHLGIMMFTLGTGAVAVALFHLVVHGISKALLFLCAGSVSHGTGTLEISELGGLRHKMPITFWCCSVGALGLSGVPPLSGWFSKDEILLALQDHGGWGLFGCGLVIAVLSALYMTRVWFRVFFGTVGPNSEPAHESPAGMLIVLVVLGIGAGGFGVGSMGYFLGMGSFTDFVSNGQGAHHATNWPLLALSILAVLSAIGLSWAIYVKRYLSSAIIQDRLTWLHRLAVNKFYLDDAYQWGIDQVVLRISRGVATFDRVIVNDSGVDGTGKSVVFSAFTLRGIQTGRVYNYALGIVFGIVAIFALVGLNHI